MSRLRNRAAGLALALALTTALALVAATAATAADGSAAPAPAHGLIVRLKNAPAHEQPDAALHRRETLRWGGVLRGAALSGMAGQREPLRRAVGRDQHLLDFGRELPPEEALRLAERLRRHPDVDWVEPNAREQRLALSNDPLSADQWWLMPVSGSNQNALAARLRGVPGFLSAWQSGIAGASGRSSAVVAVLDTGITTHPDLAGHVLPGYDFVSEALFANDGDSRDNDPSDPGDWVSAADLADSRFKSCSEGGSTWHGTVIAGLVAALTDNGVGVAGINRDGRVLPVRVAGKCGAAVADIIDGMRWAAGLAVSGAPVNANPARILNISFGSQNPCNPAYQSAVDELRTHGVLVVAAAGNEHGATGRPANCNGVIGVVALNRDGFKSHYSNFGSALTASGIATVGGDDSGGGAWAGQLADNGLLSVWNHGSQGPAAASYAYLFGTSFSAPLVAGTLSLMLSVNPALSTDQLLAGLRASARPHVTSWLIAACSEANPGRCICSTQSCGVGILDVDQAVRFAANPASYVAPARQPEVIDSVELRQAVTKGPDRPPNPGAEAPREPAMEGGGAASFGWVLALVVACALLISPGPRRA